MYLLKVSVALSIAGYVTKQIPQILSVAGIFSTHGFPSVIHAMPPLVPGSIPIVVICP